MKKVVQVSLENSKVRTVKTDSEVQVAVGDKNVVLRIQLLDEGTHTPKKLTDLQPFEFRATNPGRNIIVKTDGFTLEDNEMFLDFVLPEEIYSQSGLIQDAVIRANINGDVYSTEHFFILILPTPGIAEAFPDAIDAVKTVVNDLRNLINQVQSTVGSSTGSIISDLKESANSAIKQAIDNINSTAESKLSDAANKAVDGLVDSLKQENEPKIEQVLTDLTKLGDQTTEAIKAIAGQIPEKQKEIKEITSYKDSASNLIQEINDLKTQATTTSESTLQTLNGIVKQANSLLDDIKQTAQNLLIASSTNENGKERNDVSSISLGYDDKASNVLKTIVLGLKNGSNQTFSMTETIKKIILDNPSLIGNVKPPDLSSYASKKYVDDVAALKVDKPTPLKFTVTTTPKTLFKERDKLDITYLSGSADIEKSMVILSNDAGPNTGASLGSFLYCTIQFYNYGKTNITLPSSEYSFSSLATIDLMDLNKNIIPRSSNLSLYGYPLPSSMILVQKTGTYNSYPIIPSFGSNSYDKTVMPGTYTIGVSYYESTEILKQLKGRVMAPEEKVKLELRYLILNNAYYTNPA